jgi:hypothetical protein
MMKMEAIDQEFVDQAKGYETLGPNYFSARKIAGDFMEKFKEEQFDELIKDAADKFHERLSNDLHDYLLGNTEGNLQTSIWRQIDGSVNALLSGDKWALERYALGSRYDQEKVRAAIAKHIPAELQDKRIADLEAQLAEAKRALAIAGRRH